MCGRDTNRVCLSLPPPLRHPRYTLLLPLSFRPFGGTKKPEGANKDVTLPRRDPDVPSQLRWGTSGNEATTFIFYLAPVTGSPYHPTHLSYACWTSFAAPLETAPSAAEERAGRPIGPATSATATAAAIIPLCHCVL